MKTESLIRIMAGTVVLTSITLAHFVSEWWLLLAVFASLNLIQSAFTGFCPPEILFKKLGIAKDGGSCCGRSEKKEA